MNDEDVRTSLRCLPKARGRLLLRVFVFTLALLLLSTPLAKEQIRRLGLSVARILITEGDRLQGAGAIENAESFYLTAMVFSSNDDQYHLQANQRLGFLYWRRGDYEEALPYLRQVSKSVVSELSFFEPYCDVLDQLALYDEAEVAIKKWRALAAELGNNNSLALAKYYQGRGLLARGFRREARQEFDEAIALDKNNRAHEELATLAYEDSNFELALRHIDAYLTIGERGIRTVYLQSLRDSISKNLGATG